RQHVDMQPAMRALRQCGVPYQVAGGRGFFQEREVKDALALLAAVEDPDELDLVAAQRCVQDIRELHGASQREDVRDLFQLALEASGFLGIIDEQSGVARLQMGANLNKLGELLEAFADWSDDRRVSTTLRYLTVLRDSREAGELASIEPIE